MDIKKEMSISKGKCRSWAKNGPKKKGENHVQ